MPKTIDFAYFFEKALGIYHYHFNGGSIIRWINVHWQKLIFYIYRRVMESCPLCLENNQSILLKTKIRFHKKDYERQFIECRCCGLVYLLPRQRVSLDFEKQRYTEHENDITQQGYRNFLLQMWAPLKEKLSFPCVGLDYGCGPTKAFAELIDEIVEQDRVDLEGKKIIEVDSFDPFFEPNGIKKEKYDFIWFHEAIEHCHDPLKELKKINGLLMKSGILAIGTSMLEEVSNFSSWNYHKDITHIVFFQNKTFKWVANEFNWKYERVSYRVHLFQC